MPDLAVRTSFNATGDILKTLNKIDRSMDKFGKTSTRAFKRASTGAAGFKTIMKGILAAGAVQKTLGALSRGVSAVTVEFLGFDQAITSAAAKFKDVNLQTADGRAKFDALKKSAREIGATTEFSAGQAAQGLKFMSLAGFNSAQAMANLRNLTDLATSAEVDLAFASDIATDSLGAFGLMTSDTAQLQKNFTRLNDVMALTMARSNVNAEDFFETVKKSAATFTSSGQKLETFGALTGIMADAGKKGSEAGTTLNNMMLRLSNATPEAAEALKLMGVVTQDSEGNFRDIVDILADVKKGTEDLGTAERAAALDIIFGKRAITGVNILLEKGIPAIRAYREELENAAGSSEKMAEIMRSSLTNQLKGLQSAVIEVGFQLFSAFSGEGQTAIQGLTEIIRNIDLTPLINGIRSFVEFTAPIRAELTPAFIKLWELMKSIFTLMETTGAFSAMKMGLNGVVKILTGTLKIFGAIFDIFKTIIDGITTIVNMIPTLPTGVLEAGAKKQAEFQGSGINPMGPPSQVEAQARAQQLRLNQQVNINNAPPGTTADIQTKAAPQLAFAGIGANTTFNTQ